MKNISIEHKKNKAIRVIRLSTDIVFYFSVFLFLLLFDQSDDLFLEFYVYVMFLQIFRVTLSGWLNAFDFVVALVGVFLFVIPSIALIYFRGIDTSFIVFFYVAIFDFIAFVRKRYFLSSQLCIRADPLSSSDKKRLYSLFSILVFWCAVAGLLFPETPLFSYLAFLMPFSIALLVFERLISSELSLFKIYTLLFILMAVVVVYITLYWSGFGRLLIGAYILMPILVANHYRDFGIRMWQIVLASPVALYVAQLSRYNIISSLDQVFIGSAGHHLIVTNDLLNLTVVNFKQGIDQFLDQFLLFFFNWFPRDLWSSKPIGAGLVSVDDIYSRQGYGEGYSQSLGFLGEQVYLLGDYFGFGLIVVLMIYLLIDRYLLSYSSGYIAPSVVWEVSLISYVWGGMATFGSRSWFILLPCLIVANFFFRPILKKN